MSTTPAPPRRVAGKTTLVLDIGGTGLKATVLDPKGKPLHDRLRVATTYPCPPDKLVADLVALVAPLPAYDRVSAGFPGVVRNGRTVTAPHFITKQGPGSKVDPHLVEAWSDFDLAGALATALGRPAKVGNDADVQGAGEVSGEGLEVVLTFGTGLGSAVFRDGKLALHLELAHHPGPAGEPYEEYLGDAARKRSGHKRWNKRVRRSLVAIDALFTPDALLLGGGNAERIDLNKLHEKHPDIAAKARVVGNDGGLLGGIHLWDGTGLEQPEVSA